MYGETLALFNTIALKLIDEIYISSYHYETTIENDIFCVDVGDRNANENVDATVKYDGTLGIAFAWNGEVMVTTKRRMDSEQAIWAKQWIEDHCNLTSFQAGYTYLFEIIYQSNTVVVNYLFEGLVLLAITDENGDELPYEDVLNCAKNMGFFMVTPRITASYSEILWYCGGIDDTTKESTPPNRPALISGALPENTRQEGWVVKFNDGSRQKIVYSWRKKVLKIACLVHPQIVWLLVKYDKFGEILCHLPSHFHIETRRMIQAIGRKFMETVRTIEQHLTDLHVESQSSTQHRSDFFPSDSKNDAGEETLSAQTENLRLNDDDIKTSAMTTSKDQVENTEKNDMTEARNFVRLARKFKNYRRGISEKPDETQQNISPIYKQDYWGECNYKRVRVPVLDYICPLSPKLDGYQPSDNFKQTWCKGWKTLPINDIQFIQKVFQENHSTPQFLQLPDEVIVSLLEFLDGESVVMMTRVCVRLHDIVNSFQALEHKIALAKKKSKRKLTYLPKDCGYRRRYPWGGYDSN